MTVIAAASWHYKGRQRSAIACDTAGTDGWGMQQDHGTKLVTLPGGCLGFSGSYRTGQLLARMVQTSGVLSRRAPRGIEEVAGFADELRSKLKADGWTASKEGGTPNHDGMLAILLNDQHEIWKIQGDFAVLRSQTGDAVGSGYQVARGTLGLANRRALPPRYAAASAVQTAIDNISTCGGKVRLWSPPSTAPAQPAP